jgi:FSR family fosmidomycin resistance protein-like MFS transporter
VFALNPVVSGLSQPIFAFLTDRWNTRIFGPLGLLVGGVAISAVGWVRSYEALIALQVVGMIGVGVYHPVGSAVAGRLGRDALSGSPRRARSMGLSVFFAGGMLGGVVGPPLASAIAGIGPHGMEWLLVLAIPAIVGSAAMWAATQRVAHRSDRLILSAPAHGSPAPLANVGARWATVWLLYCTNSLRFMNNTGLYYLFTAWAAARNHDAAAASHSAAWLLAATSLGMGIVGIVVGWVSPAGKEKRLLVVTGFIGAPLGAVMPWLDWQAMLVVATLASMCQFAAIPLSIGLAQRLLPHATGFTGSLLMGCGWAVAAVAPLGLSRLLNPERFVGLKGATGLTGLELGFAAMGGCLLLSGLLSLLLPRRLLEESARHEH